MAFGKVVSKGISMERITIKDGIKYSNGYEGIASAIFISIVLTVIFLTSGLPIWLSFIMMIIIVLLGIVLYVKYCNVKRIVDNQLILHTKVVDAKLTYSSGEFVFKLEKGPVYLSCSYFDEKSGQTYMFESFCVSKPFKLIPRYYTDYGDKHILALDSVDVCVNKDNYNEYFFLLDRLYSLSDDELEEIRQLAKERRDIKLEHDF